MSLDEGRKLRDAGVSSVLTNELDAWKRDASQALAMLASNGEPFSADDIRERVGNPPHHFNAMGAVFRVASIQGLIRRVGYEQSTRSSRHASFRSMWIGTSTE